MIKKVPYTENLIRIGNAPAYPGKPIFSDGKVAYGWLYNNNKQIKAIEKGGLWVDAEISSGYYNWRLLNTNGTWGAKYVGSPDIYNMYYAYPWIAEKGNANSTGLIMKGRNASYTYNGTLIQMDGLGRLLSYYDDGNSQYLLAYRANGEYMATNVSQFFASTDLWQLTLQDNERTHLLSYRGSWQMATVSGAYITQKEEDPESPDPQNPEYYWVTYYCSNRLITPTYTTRRIEDPNTGIVTYTTTPNLPEIQLNSKVTFSYRTLDITIENEQGSTTTYRNDPLGLLPATSSEASEPTEPSGVHAYNDIILIQQRERQAVTGLWKDGHAIQPASDVYIGASNCFSLEKITRW